MPLGNGFPVSSSGASSASKSPADLQFGSYVIHDSSGMLEPLDVPLKGLDVPLGGYIVIRVQDGSREL